MQKVVFLLQSLLFAQHVSGAIMPIIGSSRVMQMIVAYGTWRFGLQIVGLVWSCGLCVRFAGCCSIQQTEHYNTCCKTLSHAPEDDQNIARNMLS